MKISKTKKTTKPAQRNSKQIDSVLATLETDLLDQVSGGSDDGFQRPVAIGW